MARTSNREQKKRLSLVDNNAQNVTKIYRAVIYARISSEDDRKIASHTIITPKTVPRMLLKDK